MPPFLSKLTMYQPQHYYDELNKKEEERMLNEMLLDACYVDPNEEISHPPVAISMGETQYETSDGIVSYPIPIGTYGNISFIQAPPKHKKTFLVTLLSAAYLGGSHKLYTGNIIGHRDGKCIYHFDTEQGSFHAQKVFQRVLKMTELTNECYQTYALRTLTVPERLRAIEHAIEYADNLGLLIIDGVADLVQDVNNIEESNAVVQKLMKWSEVKQCHILTVIHTNYNTDKPTGHLGSALEKKAETQIHLKKSEMDDTIINVSCKSSRSKSFDDFSFMVNKNNLPLVLNDRIDLKKKEFVSYEDIFGNTNKADSASVSADDKDWS